MRNGYGENSAWYRRIRRTGTATFLDHSARYQARIEPVIDEPTKKRVDDAYKTKHRSPCARRCPSGSATTPCGWSWTMTKGSPVVTGLGGSGSCTGAGDRG
ncbi:hypothetical protein [Saccharopolyspora soli]|uniref:hypothetical protein n=1 Tax=Saccharopolyspora soli TaxID=2926618 RepID=UPI00355717C9